MTVRKPAEGDHSQILGLMNEYFRFNHQEGSIPVALAPFEEEVGLDKELEDYVTEIINGPHYFGFVAEDQDQLVGFIVGSMKDRQGYKLDREGYVEDFFVAAEHRSQGIGTQLFSRLVEDFKKRGATHLALDAYAANQSAIDLYHQWGFVDSELVMRRKLDV